jgi:hypothetical protein
MKTLTLVGRNGKHLRLNGQAPVAVGVLLILGGVPRRTGLTVKDLIERLVEYGILLNGKDEEATMSGLLQRLLKLGAVKHPNTGGGTWRYALDTMPSIELPGGRGGAE